jgi:hypothetical protein
MKIRQTILPILVLVLGLIFTHCSKSPSNTTTTTQDDPTLISRNWIVFQAFANGNSSSTYVNDKYFFVSSGNYSYIDATGINSKTGTWKYLNSGGVKTITLDGNSPDQKVMTVVDLTTTRLALRYNAGSTLVDIKLMPN